MKCLGSRTGLVWADVSRALQLPYRAPLLAVRGWVFSLHILSCGTGESGLVQGLLCMYSFIPLQNVILATLWTLRWRRRTLMNWAFCADTGLFKSNGRPDWKNQTFGMKSCGGVKKRYSVWTSVGYVQASTPQRTWCQTSWKLWSDSAMITSPYRVPRHCNSSKVYSH